MDAELLSLMAAPTPAPLPVDATPGGNTQGTSGRFASILRSLAVSENLTADQGTTPEALIQPSSTYNVAQLAPHWLPGILSSQPLDPASPITQITNSQATALIPRDMSLVGTSETAGPVFEAMAQRPRPVDRQIAGIELGVRMAPPAIQVSIRGSELGLDLVKPETMSKVQNPAIGRASGELATTNPKEQLPALTTQSNSQTEQGVTKPLTLELGINTVSEPKHTPVTTSSLGNYGVNLFATAAPSSLDVNTLHAPSPQGMSHSNQQLAIASPLGSQKWGLSLGHQLGRITLSGEQQVAIQLHPRELGPLLVEMHVKEQHAQLSFFSNQPLVRQSIEQALPQLREILGEQGIELGETDISAEQGAHQQQPQNRHPSAELRGLIDTPSATAPTATSERHIHALGINIYV
ncbi:hypothetical protein BST95_07405 [Halioglobus japonicus]|uniref:Flagellar hook-length control protein-like C-terminal domain-containing protein n=1 Tax=Halioglobus japonicus TaxID=930805 RepID=A0AAP8SN42_9GAMM|nr:flagellar hook-length control protein FliK [Halioglobus japonicus]AQA18094.1 hypothetical protein BST95_07405 [Halioglobus japonicus]PLW86086.1 hypothetical protein C0029_06450 [Halioglobus japonicus]GHD14552.1 hypothetical protein GCM10007052_18400 [Halioglobus japonicus]